MPTRPPFSISLTEMVEMADLIVIAQFVSEANVVVRKGGVTTTRVYQPGKLLKFQIIEFLKGESTETIFIEVWRQPPHHEDGMFWRDGFLTEDLAFGSIPTTDPTYLDRPGVLFLKVPRGSRLGNSRGSWDVEGNRAIEGDDRSYGFYEFMLFGGKNGSEFQYSVSNTSHTWLPFLEPVKYDEGTDPQLIIDGEIPPSTIYLSVLKAIVAQNSKQ